MSSTKTKSDWNDESTSEISVTLLPLSTEQTHSVLELVQGPGAPRQYELHRSEMVVGRSPDNAIAIHSRSLSRRHSRFSCRNGRLLIDDLGSTNGTMVNGRRVDAEHELHHGDLVLIGDATFRIELP